MYIVKPSVVQETTSEVTVRLATMIAETACDHVPGMIRVAMAKDNPHSDCLTQRLKGHLQISQSFDDGNLAAARNFVA